jgi:hypothetical protein
MSSALTFYVELSHIVLHTVVTLLSEKNTQHREDTGVIAQLREEVSLKNSEIAQLSKEISIG